MVKIIKEHSVDVDLLTGGWVIDAGCRGWLFSNAMKELGEKVYALDIDYMTPPEGIIFERKAINYRNGIVTVFIKEDLAATHTSEVALVGNPIKSFTAESITLQEIANKLGEEADVLKLDIEGSEYLLLSNNFIPIAKQLSIEFHEHCFPEIHKKYFDKCISEITKHYDIAYLERVPMHGAGLNYWDSCFIKKGL